MAYFVIARCARAEKAETLRAWNDLPTRCGLQLVQLHKVFLVYLNNECRTPNDHPIAIVRLRNPLERHILTRLEPMAAQQRLAKRPGNTCD